MTVDSCSTIVESWHLNGWWTKTNLVGIVPSFERKHGTHVTEWVISTKWAFEEGIYGPCFAMWRKVRSHSEVPSIVYQYVSTDRTQKGIGMCLGVLLRTQKHPHALFTYVCDDAWEQWFCLCERDGKVWCKEYMCLLLPQLLLSKSHFYSNSCRFPLLS